MPKQSINHLNTIMYKIVCKDTEITDCYAGKTTDFTRRKSEHKRACNALTHVAYEYNVYQYIRANGGWDNWDMIQIEKYEAVDMLDSKARERYWIENLQAKLNKCIPLRTQQEWYQENKEKINTYRQNYLQENKEKIQDKNKEYRLKNKDTYKTYRQEYNLKNKDKIQESQQKYYQANKDKILKQQQERALHNKVNNLNL